MYVIVDIVKEGEHAPPPSPARAGFTLVDGMYARKWPLPLCVLCDMTIVHFLQVHTLAFLHELGYQLPMHRAHYKKCIFNGATELYPYIT